MTQPADLDATVIAAAQQGDVEAHAAIYRHYANRLFTLIYRIVPRRPQAEDLMQEVFVEVLRSIRSYAGTGSFYGWLRAIAVNRTMAQLRSPWVRGQLWLDDALAPETEPMTPALDESVLAQRELSAALRKLSPDSRAVVWLHDVEGFTHGEIAKLFGRTVSFSKSQLHRAHERLRELLGEPELALPVRTSHEHSLPIGTLPCTPTPPLSINS